MQNVVTVGHRLRPAVVRSEVGDGERKPLTRPTTPHAATIVRTSASRADDLMVVWTR
jgi:hypothetical protein